jgi:co-chaperonin GroES (HSP10)
MELRTEKIRAIKNNVLIQFGYSEEGIEGVTNNKTSKIVLPDTWNKNKFAVGKVLSVGSLVTNIKEGDWVIARPLSGVDAGMFCRMQHQDIIEAVYE